MGLKSQGKESVVDTWQYLQDGLHEFLYCNQVAKYVI